MILWVHCNKCFMRFSSKMKFYITNCYHMYCESCLQKVKQTNTCLVCDSDKPAFIQLGNEMPDSVKALFTSVEEPMEKAQKIVMFQMSNCLNLLKQTVGKYTQLKVEYAKMAHTLNVQKNQIKKLKEALMMSRSMASRNSYEASTPRMDQTNISNMSSPFNNVTLSTIQRPHCSPYNNNYRMPTDQGYGFQRPMNMPQESQGNHGFTSNQGQKPYPGRVVPNRPSSYQMPQTFRPSSSGSMASSGLSSLRNLSLLGSAHRQAQAFNVGHPKFAN